MKAQTMKKQVANNISKEVPKHNKPLVGRMKFYYKNPIADGYFSYLLAFGARGGADVGEAFAAVSNVGQYDTEAWVRELTKMANLVEKEAHKSLSRGHTITARDTFLRVYYLNRAALLNLSPVKETQRYNEIRKHAVENFRKAAALYNPPIEAIEIEFEGKKLPGYFIKPDNRNIKRPTLYNVGGGESFCEDMCMVFGIGDQERGYNMITVDLPGMGNTAAEGMKMEPAMEKPVSKVIDYLESRPDVDMERLAVFGPSMGGYTVARAASKDKRIKAMIANSIILNQYDYLVQAKELKTLAKYENFPLFKMLTRLFGSWLAGLFNVMDVYKWRWKVNTIKEWLDACKEFTADPSEIKCPSLLMVGEDELAYWATKGFINESLKKIDNPKVDLVIGKAELGASGKNMLPNLTLIRHTVYDWLDEIFLQTTEKVSIHAAKEVAKEISS
ncbi:alpha/beta hydrolase [Pleomorphovibrio marinus]|uniref:alpha/beta hydrolase n=1 Tax=Pleomorphovibrio marinus TaxID=2164132 RepID=UPI000E0BE9FE|nr:alpha/beta hydrolase [Pleomorphovibrio marinus]